MSKKGRVSIKYVLDLDRKNILHGSRDGKNVCEDYFTPRNKSLTWSRKPRSEARRMKTLVAFLWSVRGALKGQTGEKSNFDG